MKVNRILITAIAAVMTVSLFACSSSPAAILPAQTPSAAAPSVTPEPSPSATPPQQVTTLHIGMYSDGADPYVKLIHDALQVCANEDPTCHWTIDYKAGQKTPADQLQSVKDFITAQCDALVVIQNSVDATSQCITKAKAVGIPYFGAVRSFASASNATDAAGSCVFDFVQEGKYAGAEGAKSGAKKLVMIEGQLVQESASDQALGYLQAYQESGKNLGGATAQDIVTKQSKVKQNGQQDITVVYWASGGGLAASAQKTMAKAISSLGPKGFDGVYTENDLMMEGVLAAIKSAGLDASKYYLSSGGGSEESWDWVKNGTVQCDVNQSAALEGDTLYQQIKAYFTKQPYRKYVYPYLTEFDANNMNQVFESLIPCTSIEQYMSLRTQNKFVHDITDPKFIDIANMGNTDSPDVS